MARHFVKHYITPGRDLARVLSDREAAALWRLAFYVRLRDNVIRGPDGTPLDQAGIAAVLGKSERQTREILAELERRGVIEDRGRGQGYAISPGLVWRGGP